MPLAVDEELGIIFREMRRASHLDQHQLSDQLGTPIAMVEALETGAISALPAWPETIRVVNAYTRMLGLDPRPILRRIRSQIDAAAASPQPKEVRPAAPVPAPPRPPMPPAAAPKAQPMPMPPDAAVKQQPLAPGAPAQPAARPVPQRPPPANPLPQASAVLPEPDTVDADMVVDGEPGVIRRMGRRLAKWIFVLALCAALGYAISHVVRNPQVIVDTVAGLPEPIPSAARLIRDIVATSPGRKAPAEGADAQPQKGKSDRLPQEQAPAVR